MPVFRCLSGGCRLKTIIGYSFFFLLTVLLVKSAGEISTMWNWTTFTFVTVGPSCLLFARKSKAEILEFGSEVRAHLLEALDRVGTIGAIIGFIQMLHNFSDPKLIGPGMAISLLSIFYSQFLSLLVSKSEPRSPGDRLSLMPLFFLVGSFFLILLSLK